MNNPAATAYAGEFRTVKRDLPLASMRMLLCFTVFYGAVLTLTLPWIFHDVLFRETGARDRSWLAALGGGLPFVFGSLTMLRWCVVQSLAFWGYADLMRSKPSLDREVLFVSIMVPAYNESDTIEAALRSLIDLDYPHYEIIMVDDGSTDDTYAKALPFAGEYEHCTVRVYKKPNGGKWSALNFAFNRAKGEYLLCVDADSRLSKDALMFLVPRLRDPAVVGVSGHVTIRNRKHLLTRLQAIEYMLFNGAIRMAQSLLGTVTVVPGPIGLYKRAVMEKIATLPLNQRRVASHGVETGKVYGPISGETFAEDFQLSLTALALGGKIVYEPRAVAYTKAPDTIETLMNQRYRWIRGTWQVIRIYLRDLRQYTRGNWRLEGMMVSLYTMDVYVFPILNFFFWGSLAVTAASGTNLGGAAACIGAVWLLNLITATACILLQDDDLSLLPLILVLDLYQSLLVNSAWVIGVLDELRGARMKWS